MKKRESKNQDIVDRVISENPATKFPNPTVAKRSWNIWIKAEIAKKSIEKEDPTVADPMGIPDEINDDTRAIAKSLISDNKVMTQIVRVDKPKIESITLHPKTGKVIIKSSKSNPVGAMVAFISDNGKLRIGWSKYCMATEDELVESSNSRVTLIKRVLREKNPFTKKKAVQTAVLRGLSDYIRFNVDSKTLVTLKGNNIPRMVSKQLNSFTKKAATHFKQEPINVIPSIIPSIVA